MSPLRVAAIMVPLGALAAGPAAGPNAAAQTIELRSYAYAPPVIHLAAGKPVTLHFVNRAGKGHDFTARKLFAASRIVSGSAPDGEIDLGPGQRRSVTLVPAAGTYKVHCGRMFHKALGMRGTIVVH